MKGRLAAVAVAAILALTAAATAATAPPADRILGLAQYTSEKGRALAVKHADALRALNTEIYHCMPWVDVQKESIGFFRPKQAQRDDRYLSIRIYIEQDPSPAFARLDLTQRVSAMFSRYVGAMLRRMTESPALSADPALDGFTVILEWLKPTGNAVNGRPVHETVAIFIEKPIALDYLGRRLGVDQLAERANVLAWDGETAVGPVHASAWDDNFVATYKVKNYELESGVSCPKI